MKIRSAVLATVATLALALTAACSSSPTGSPSAGSTGGSTGAATTAQQGASAGKSVAFIPKLTGVGYFESGGAGAVAAGKKLGLNVSYTGAPEASVANQVQLVNTAIQQGVSAIVIAATDPEGLCQVLKKAMSQGILVLTWDSDVNPECRSYYISQGTPTDLGTLLVDMVSKDLPKDQPAEVAFHYSSPTVTDQNQWVDVAKKLIASDTKWTVVDTVFSQEQTDLAVQQAEALINAHPNLKAIICPDANALPGTAQAVANLKRTDITVVGFSTPNVMKGYIKDGTIKRFALWDVTKQGALTVAVAKYLLDGHKLNVGDSFDASNVGLGTLKVQPNSVQGYKYEADGNGIIVLPERVVFTADNIANYNF